MDCKRKVICAALLSLQQKNNEFINSTFENKNYYGNDFKREF